MENINLNSFANLPNLGIPNVPIPNLPLSNLQIPNLPNVPANLPIPDLPIPFYSYLINNIVKPAMILMGSFYSLKLSLQSFFSVYTALKLYIWPQIFKLNLHKKYGEYVIITNTLDCIGTEFAKAFARRGHSLVLIGENNDAFQRVKADIEKELKEECCLKVILKDETQNDDHIYQHIEDEISEIRSEIGIIVNNAGISIAKTDKFLEYSDDDVLDVIHSNVVDVLMITKAVLPIMVENKKGLIINVTSPSNFRPIAFSGFPSAMKEFVVSFGRILAAEYRVQNIDVQTLNPGWIMKEPNILLNCAFPSFLLPTAKTFVNSAISTIGRSEQTCGYWGHSLISKIMSFIPNGIHSLIFYFYKKCTRKDKDEHLSRKQEVLEAIHMFTDAVKK